MLFEKNLPKVRDKQIQKLFLYLYTCLLGHYYHPYISSTNPAEPSIFPLFLLSGMTVSRMTFLKNFLWQCIKELEMLRTAEVEVMNEWNETRSLEQIKFSGLSRWRESCRYHQITSITFLEWHLWCRFQVNIQWVSAIYLLRSGINVLSQEVLFLWFLVPLLWVTQINLCSVSNTYNSLL